MMPTKISNKRNIASNLKGLGNKFSISRIQLSEDTGSSLGSVSSGLGAAVGTLSLPSLEGMQEKFTMVESLTMQHQLTLSQIKNNFVNSEIKNIQRLEKFRQKAMKVDFKSSLSLEKGKAKLRSITAKDILAQGDALMKASDGKNKKMFKVGKALALAQAGVAGVTAVVESFKNGGGYPWGLIPAGLMAVTAIKNIQKIKNTKYQGGGGGSSPTPDTGSGGSATPPTSSFSSVEMPSLGGGASATSNYNFASAGRASAASSLGFSISSDSNFSTNVENPILNELVEIKTYLKNIDGDFALGGRI